MDRQRVEAAFGLREGNHRLRRNLQRVKHGELQRNVVGSVAMDQLCLVFRAVPEEARMLPNPVVAENTLIAVTPVLSPQQYLKGE